MDGQPLVERVGEGLGIHAVDEIVDRFVAGHDQPAALVAHVEADGLALALAQGAAAFPDRFDGRRAD